MLELIRNRDLIFYKAGADLRREARRFYISYLWWFFEPILEMFVYYLLFAVLLQRGGPDFVPFLLIGITIWRWFAVCIQHGSSSIVQSKGLIQQVKLPKAIFPAIVILTDTFKFFIILVMLIVFLWFWGYPININYLAIPVVLGTELLLLTAGAYLTSIITPYFPDFTILLRQLLHAWFFLSGIFYDASHFSEEMQFYFYLNPMADLIEDMRLILMHNTLPDFTHLAIISGASMAVFLFSVKIINHLDQTFPRILSK